MTKATAGQSAAALLAVAALHLYLVAGLPALLLGPAMHDDALFLRSASHLASGHWLGPYDNRTLARGPFFPAFVALCFQMGVPLRVAQSLLYLASGALLLFAVRPWPGAGWSRVMAFAVYAFNPMLYQTDMLRVTREGVYVPLTVLVLGLSAWLLRIRDAPLPRRLAVAVALGLAVSAFWLTREEGPWILPALACGAGALIASRLGERTGRAGLARDGLVLLAAAAVAAAGVQVVCLVNSRRYDTWCAVEFRQEAFARAYGALLRLEPGGRKPFVPVTRQALRRAPKAGPMAAEVVAQLDSGIADAWATHGCEAHRVEPCDGEVRGGWFMFALRDAAANAGHYVSGGEAEVFYRRLSEEIDAACASERLECGPPRRGFIPPLAPGDVQAIAHHVLRGATILASFGGFTLRPATSQGTAEDFVRYAPLVGSHVFPADATTAPPLGVADRLRFGLLPRVAMAYRWLTPPLAASALLAFAWRLRTGFRALLTPSLPVAAMLVAAVASRLLLVGFIAATSIPILNPRYLSEAYPPLLLFTALVLAGAAESLRARPSTGTCTAGPSPTALLGPS